MAIPLHSSQSDLASFHVLENEVRWNATHKALLAISGSRLKSRTNEVYLDFRTNSAVLFYPLRVGLVNMLFFYY